MKVRALFPLLLVLAPALVSGQPIQRRPDREVEGDRARRVLELLGAEHLVREAWRKTSQRYYARDSLGDSWRRATPWVGRLLAEGSSLRRVHLQGRVQTNGNEAGTSPPSLTVGARMRCRRHESPHQCDHVS